MLADLCPGKYSYILNYQKNGEIHLKKLKYRVYSDIIICAKYNYDILHRLLLASTLILFHPAKRARIHLGGL